MTASPFDEASEIAIDGNAVSSGVQATYAYRMPKSPMEGGTAGALRKFVLGSHFAGEVGKLRPNSAVVLSALGKWVDLAEIHDVTDGAVLLMAASDRKTSARELLVARIDPSQPPGNLRDVFQSFGSTHTDTRTVMFRSASTNSDAVERHLRGAKFLLPQAQAALVEVESSGRPWAMYAAGAVEGHSLRLPVVTQDMVNGPFGKPAASELARQAELLGPSWRPVTGQPVVAYGVRGYDVSYALDLGTPLILPGVAETERTDLETSDGDPADVPVASDKRPAPLRRVAAQDPTPKTRLELPALGGISDGAGFVEMPVRPD